MDRGIVLSILALIVGLPLAGQPPDVLGFVQSNCAGCHNASAKSGGLDLTALRTAETFESDRETWGKVAQKLAFGEMPPGVPRPPSQTIADIASWLKSQFDRQDRLVRPEAGQVSARSLNRAEYNNTIRDLLGVDIRPADNFPADTAAFGFDNISDALRFSPEMMEKYIDAAERSVSCRRTRTRMGPAPASTAAEPRLAMVIPYKA